MAVTVNLFGETEPYGPTGRVDPGRHLRATVKLGAGGLSTDHPRNAPDNPLGAPPLDWWVIDDGPS